MLLKRGLPLLSPFLVKRLSLMIFSDLLLFRYRKTKFNNTVIGHYSILLGSRSYHIWSKSIISMLSAYFVWFCRWNSHVCGAPCWSRPYKSSTEVKTSRQTYPWPYGQYDWWFTSVSCHLWLNRSAYIPFHLKRPLGQAKDSLWHHRLYSRLSFI